MDNIALCNEVTDNVVQQIVHAIESNGKHVQYLRLLQTLLKAEGQLIRKTQDLVMAEVSHYSFQLPFGVDKMTWLQCVVQSLRTTFGNGQ